MFALLAVLVPLAGGVVFATAPEARYVGASAVKEIRYEGSGCYGWCPAYSLTFGADGHARYEGIAFVRERGVFAASFEPHRFARFADALFRRGFFSARKPGVDIADAPSTTVTVTFNDGTAATTSGLTGYLVSDLADDLYSAGYFIDGFAINLCGWHRIAAPAGQQPVGPFAPISTAPCRAGLVR